MGSYQSLYVGPYVVCLNAMRKETIQVRSCPNAACSKPKPKSRWDKVDAPFCASCGSAITDVPLEVEFRPSVYDALGDDESLFLMQNDTPEDDEHVYLGANMRMGARRFYVEGGEYHLDIKAVDIAAEVRLFEEKCAEGIAACRAFYEDVVISWGVHQFYR